MNSDNEYKILGERLEQLRENYGYTQKELAVKLNINSTTYSGYERGIRKIDIFLLKQIAKFYNTSVDYLLGIDNVQKVEDEKDWSKEELDYLQKTKEILLENRKLRS